MNSNDAGLTTATASPWMHLGTFDVANFGDCLFPYLFRAILDEIDPRSDLDLASPTARSAHLVNSGLDLHSLEGGSKGLSMLSQYDNAVLGGGQVGTFSHEHGTYAHLSVFSAPPGLRLWAMPALASVRTGHNYFIYSVGINEVPQPRRKLLTASFQAAAASAVRDGVSAARLQACGFEVDVVPDIITVLPLLDHRFPVLAAEATRDAVHRRLGDRYIVAQCSRGYVASWGEDGLRTWVRQIANLSRQLEAKVVLLPICHFLGDTDLLERILPLFVEAGALDPEIVLAPNVFDTLMVIRHAEAVVGTSLHVVLSAAAYDVPFLSTAVEHSGKHHACLEVLGLEGFHRERPDGFELSDFWNRDQVDWQPPAQEATFAWWRRAQTSVPSPGSIAEATSTLEDWWKSVRWSEPAETGPVVTGKMFLKLLYRLTYGRFPSEIGRPEESMVSFLDPNDFSLRGLPESESR